MENTGVEVKSPRVGTVAITKPPVFKGPIVQKSVKERATDILTQITLSGEAGLNMNDLKKIFGNCTQGYLYGPLMRLAKEGKIFRLTEVGKGGVVQYTTIKPYVAELEKEEKNRIATIVDATSVDKYDPVKDSHTLIRGTVGYEIISKVEIEDMPAVMRFLKILSETNKANSND